jgi:hypothetical protein
MLVLLDGISSQGASNSIKARKLFLTCVSSDDELLLIFQDYPYLSRGNFSIALVGDNSSMDLKFHLIENITNDFSEDQKVGSGGYGDVYKV